MWCSTFGAAYPPVLEKARKSVLILCAQRNRMAHKAHRRHIARQLHLKHRLRCARLVELEALEVVHHGRGHRERAAVGADELDLVARGKLVANDSVALPSASQSVTTAQTCQSRM